MISNHNLTNWEDEKIKTSLIFQVVLNSLKYLFVLLIPTIFNNSLVHYRTLFDLLCP